MNREMKRGKRKLLIRLMDMDREWFKVDDSPYAEDIRRIAIELEELPPPEVKLTEENYLRLVYENKTVKEICKLVGARQKELVEWRKEHGFYRKQIAWLKNEYFVRYLCAKQE